MEAALTQARDTLTGCAQTPLWSLPDPDLVRCLDTATALAAQVAAVQARLVAQLQTRELPARDGATSTPAWLRHRYRLADHTARQTTALARLTDQRPRTGQALATGAINPEQATVINAACAALPDQAGTDVIDRAETMLIEWAAQFDPQALRKLGARILAHVDPDLDDRIQAEAMAREQARAHARRAFTLTPTDGGRVRLSGWLDTEAAATVTAALDPLCRPRPDDERTPTQRRADALVEICTRTLASGELPEHGGDRPQVVVTVTLDTLQAALGTALLDDGGVLTATQARRIACDAHLLPAVLDSHGQVLDLGRTRRLITGPLRRALVLRDGGCAFPSCDRPPRWCAGHHVRHWADGGPTSLSNTVLLCGHHHRLVHHEDWTIRIRPDGHPEFIPPPHVDPEQRPRRNPRHHLRC